MSGIGANGLKEVYMKLSSLGAVSIQVTPQADNPEVLSVDIAAENRKDGVSMTTNKDETVDQFTQRVKSMMRSLWNAEPRVDGKTAGAAAGKKPATTWEEDKAAQKSKAGQK